MHSAARGMVLVAAAVVSCAEAKVEHHQPTMQSVGTVPDSWIVPMKDGATDAQFQAVLDVLRLEGCGESLWARSYPLHHIATVTCPRGVMAAVQQMPGVDALEQDELISVSGHLLCPAAQGLPTSWGLERLTSQSAQSLAPYRHNPQGGAGADVYVLDTGVHCDHEQFANIECIIGKTFHDYNGHGARDPYVGHGTHVAGTVAGKDYGVAKAATIISVKVLEQYGSTSNFIKGLDWAVQHHQTRGGRPAVINLSVGITKRFSAHIEKVVEEAGVSIAVAAGNSNRDVCSEWPRSPQSNAVIVGNSAPENERLGHSMGDTLWWSSNYGPCVDIVAPGTMIVSAGIWAEGGEKVPSTTRAVAMTGTSMAAPHVAGVMALYVAEHPTASPAEVKQWLLDNSQKGILTSRNRNTDSTPNRLLHVPCAGTTLPPRTPTPQTPVPPTAAPTAAPTVAPVTTTTTTTEATTTTTTTQAPTSTEAATDAPRTPAPATPLPSADENEACEDKRRADGAAWHVDGSTAFNCQWFAASPSYYCPRYATSRWTGGGLHAGQACCVCGGGDEGGASTTQAPATTTAAPTTTATPATTTAAPTTTVAPATTAASTTTTAPATTTAAPAGCRDVVVAGAAWHLAAGERFDCAWFASYASYYCPRYANAQWVGTGGLTAADACCACGGGNTAVPPTPPAYNLPALPTECAGLLLDSAAAEGQLTYPQGGGRYGLSETSCWRVRCAGTLSLEWSFFDVERKWDFVFVHAGAAGAVAVTFTGDAADGYLPQPARYGGPAVTLRLQTDSSQTGRGFALSWRCA